MIETDYEDGAYHGDFEHFFFPYRVIYVPNGKSCGLNGSFLQGARNC